MPPIHFLKTIIFCEDIDHAKRMRKAIINVAGQQAIDNYRYVMRITGDSVEGKAELDNFIDPDSKYPVIAKMGEMEHIVNVYIVAERVEYISKDGKLVTESYKDFSKKQIQSEFASLDDFLNSWNASAKKKVIIDLLEEHGVSFKFLRIS